MNPIPPQTNGPANNQFKPINPGVIPQMNQSAQGQLPNNFKTFNNAPQGQQMGGIQGQQIGGGINQFPTQQPGLIGQPNKIGFPVGGIQPGGIQPGGIQPGGISAAGGIQPQKPGPQIGGLPQKIGPMGGILKPVEHQVQTREALDLTRDPDQIIQEIIKFINNPQENDISNIINGVVQLSRDNIDLQLNYVSSRFCWITGQNFENDAQILQVPNQNPIYAGADNQFYNLEGLYFNIHEFISRIVINGILDYSIDEIDITLYNGKVKRFCFDTDTLQKLFGGEEGLQRKFDEANEHFQFRGNLLECPLLQTKFSEGIVLTDGRTYSYNGARQLYEDKKSTELDYSKIEKQKNYMNNLETLCQYINRQIDGQPKALVKYIEELCSQNTEINIQYDPQKDCEICQKSFPKVILPQCGHIVHSECIQNLIRQQPDNIFQENSSLLIKCSPRCIGNINSIDFLKNFYGTRNYHEKIQELDEKLIQQLQENDRNQKQQIERQVKFTCGICFSEESVQEKGITLDCDHRFCQECIQEVIQNKIKNGDFAEEKLICPQQNCNISIGINIIKNVCGQELYDKVLDLRNNKVERIGNDHFVKCPYCSASYFVPQELMTTFLMCKSCIKEFCPNGCQKPHQGMTCKQFQAKNESPANRDIKKCPKCETPILKNEGCNHMTCQCGHEFCWLCLGPYKPKKLCKCKKNGIMDKIFGVFGY